MKGVAVAELDFSRWARIGDVLVVIGERATKAQLEEAVLAASALLPSHPKGPAPSGLPGVFSTSKIDEDGTDRPLTCPQCGRQTGGNVCVTCWTEQI